MPRVFSNLAMVFAAQLILGHCTDVRADDQLVLGAGRPGSEAHRLGVGLSSLIKVVVLPKEGIDLRLATRDEEIDGGYLLVDRRDRLATLLEGQPADAFKSILAFTSDPPGDGPPLELIAHADVSPDAIYAFTRAIFENGPFLNTINERLWDLSFDRALHGLQFPIHRGAHRYYQRSGGLEQRIADGVPADLDMAKTGRNDAAVSLGRTFFVSFDDDQTGLDVAAREQIAAACSHASAAKAVELHIDGHGGKLTVDTAADLVDTRIRKVISALGLDANCGRSLSILVSKGAGRAVPTEILGSGADGVGISIMVPDCKKRSEIGPRKRLDALTVAD